MRAPLFHQCRVQPSNRFARHIYVCETGAAEASPRGARKLARSLAMAAAKSDAMPTSASSLLDRAVDELASDPPCILSALKNLASLMAARLAADAEVAEGGTGHAIACARAVVRALNSLELPEAPQWGIAHPQADSESAAARVECLARYRAARALAQRVDAQPATAVGTKNPTRCSLLGRRWLLATRALDDAALVAPSTVAGDVFDGFVAAFRASVEVGPAPEGVEDLEESDATLVWTHDLQVELARRRERRVSEAEARRARADKAASDPLAARLREASAGEAPAGPRAV